MKKNNFKKIMAIAVVAFMLLFGLSNRGYSNNVSVTGVGLAGANITFTLSWDNSWRNVGTANSTMNYDGVWMFVKYRDACDKTSNYPSAYNHLWLMAGDTAQIESSTNIWFSRRMGTTNTKNLGEFIYRKYDGTGSTGNISVTLVWDQVAQGTVGGNWDIRVNAIEMVYIPQGAFKLGGGQKNFNGENSYTYATNSTGLVPYTVTAENVALNNAVYVYNYSWANVGADFPKGYDPFWCMKYEITQGQYVDYLNSLDRQTQIYSTYKGYNSQCGFQDIASTNLCDESYRWVVGDYTVGWPYTPGYRQFIRAPQTYLAYQPIVFGTDANNNGTLNETSAGNVIDGQNIAMNYLYWNNGFFLKKYVDWAGLRPMSEWEYEKICRGAAAQVAYQKDEAIWGQDASVGANRNWITGIVNSDAYNEIPSTPTPATVNGEISFGNGGPQGPIRVGCAYIATTTRETAGSAYYGVTDMAGNNCEYTYTPGYEVWNGGWNNGTGFTRTNNGDGDAVNSGNSMSWPSDWEGNTYYWRGGSWYTPSSYWQNICISFRGTPTSLQNWDGGGRGVRTAE